MGDIRFLKPLERLRAARDRGAMMRALSDSEIIAALAAGSLPGAGDPYLANILATEALNRLRRARTMSQHVADAILQLDMSGRCLDANPAALRLIGRTFDETVGKPVAALLDLQHANMEGGLAESPPVTGFFGGSGEEREARLRMPDGRMIEICYRSVPVTVEHQTVGIVVALRDVTDETRRREAIGRSEARQRTLLDAVPHRAMILLSPEGIVESWNEGASRIHAFDAGEVIGRHVRTFYTQEDQRRELPEHELALAAREGIFRAQEDRMRRDGSTFRALVELTAIRDASGIRGFALVEQVYEDAPFR